jgi:predicted 3-demethylubiquinone-9 3-methyltransferase (glyoxalase superfamily)
MSTVKTKSKPTRQAADLTLAITPCLWFDDQAEEAVNFYVSVFRNSKIETITRYGPAAADRQAEERADILQLSGQKFAAAEWRPCSCLPAFVHGGR